MKSVALLPLCGFLVVCFLVFSSRTSYTYRTLYIRKVVAELVVEDLVLKVLLMPKIAQISHLSIHRVAHTVQKPQTNGQQSIFNWSISWFKHEEVIDDWLDFTPLEAGKSGPTSEDGVKYFMDTLRPHITKEVRSVFPRRCFYLSRARREIMEMVKWIANLSSLLKRLKDSWMEILPTIDRYLFRKSEALRQNHDNNDVHCCKLSQRKI